MRPEALPTTARRQLATLWADRARAEHASVASFSRFSLSLLAIGAPPELVAGAHRAAADEVRHARLALGLASRYAGSPLSFGALDLSDAFEDLGALETIVAAAVVEGCVGETLSAIEAELAARRATDGAVRDVLVTIARDETRHAELAWAFVRWALGVHGERLRRVVDRAFRDAIDAARRGDDLRRGVLVEGHGFLPDEDLAAARASAIGSVVLPAAAELFVPARAQGTALAGAVC